MPPSLSQFTTHPRSLPPGPSQDRNEVGFSPGKSPPAALIRIENNNINNNNCCSSIHDNNYSPDNSIQSLPRNIASPSINKSKSLRFMPYKRPAAATSNAKENDQDLALFGPVPLANSFSFVATSGPATPPPPTACEGDLADLVLDDEMVFKELDCITNSLHLPYSPPLSPTNTTSNFLGDDFIDDEFILFP